MRFNAQFDLKSPNILLAKDRTAKIADVGLAKFMSSNYFTKVSAVGTMAWAAPELFMCGPVCLACNSAGLNIIMLSHC